MPNLLLTGAGFSRNWGGWLASEVFDYLLGCEEIMESPVLRQLLWTHQRSNGFESALAEVQRAYVLRPQQNLDSLGRLQSAINSMFAQMNVSLTRAPFELTNNRETSIGGFLARFNAIFTLNQDLFLDQLYNPELENGPNGQERWQGVQLPGMTGTAATTAPHDARNLATRDWRPSVQPYAIERNSQPLFKLHGATNWSDHIQPSIMILGDNKAHDIGLFPILTWYYEQFERYLSQPDTRLMIIGYGFRDRHINEVIIRAVMDHGLKFFVIDPQGADIARLLNPTANAQIRGEPTPLEEAFTEGLIGASRRSLAQIFGPDLAERTKIQRFLQERD